MTLPPKTPRQLRTRVAGVFLFLPLLTHLRFHQLVQQADYPGSEMVSAPSALLSLLALKLLDKERKSHIDDFNCDEALGLFAGLNIFPKKSFATDYSYRTEYEQQQRLLAGWINRLSPLLLPEAESFSLDFHPIPHRGEETALENHYLPCRGKAQPSVQTCFAMEQKSRVFCYANANLIRLEQPGELMRFVEFWKDLTGEDPRWLYFDSKFTTYDELSRVNERGVSFVTIRRRGSRLISGLANLPASDWTSAVIDIPKRRHTRIQYHEDSVRVRDYAGSLRQIAVRGFGRSSPTLFLTNQTRLPAREVIMNYARRNHVEAGLGSNVNFFHLDCLSSEVRLNVNLDVTLTVLAQGCYRWLGSRLKGFGVSHPKQLYRKFVETSGEVKLTPGGGLQVTLDRRSHTPILREAALDQEGTCVPWLKNARLTFDYR